MIYVFYAIKTPNDFLLHGILFAQYDMSRARQRLHSSIEVDKAEAGHNTFLTIYSNLRIILSVLRTEGIVEAPVQIKDLIERFGNHIDSYKMQEYKEAHLRAEFIDVFFECLGWDVRNVKGIHELYKEVVHEDALKIGSATKAPDYCFRLMGIRKFFVEVKKPSKNIIDDLEAAFQLRRYAWSAHLPLSILTNFEYFIIYDCTRKPNKEDKSSVGRIMILHYTEYLEKWDTIASIFSYEMMPKGSFDKFAESTKDKRGTATVDDAFLEEIAGWRDSLARHIALRNQNLTVRELNYVVQILIDRIIFLRITEDRGIEPYGKLQSLLNGTNIYGRLRDLFFKADNRYNSGLFHFYEEKGRSDIPDTLTPNLILEDKVLKEIVKRLYYPDSPYEFSVLPVEILGQVYERFLGKVIRLTQGHQAKIEDKPEVRKAGGVYYTPTYIVNYIVENTVGILLQNKTPREVSSITILDPACGSGSFLLGAYQYLLDWHTKWYYEHIPKKYAGGKRPALYHTNNGEWQLTASEKKRILLNNIYGVDIDPQAVEVTKLSLLLKVLEGETDTSISKQLSLIHERALPDLSKNIQCGNSLIEPDYYTKGQLCLSFISEEEKYRINVFNWTMAFPQIFAEGGFNAVIGNPPYVFGRDWKALDISDDIKKYLRNKFESSSYQLDMFSIFMERAFFLCKNNGLIGQIVPNVWLTNEYSAKTRSLILTNSKNLKIAIPPHNVFKGLTVDTIVYTLEKSKESSEDIMIVEVSESGERYKDSRKVNHYVEGTIPISTSINSKKQFLLRFEEIKMKLKDIAKITRGVHPYRLGGYGESAFSLGKQTARDRDERPYNSKEFKDGYRPFIYGRDLKRFSPLRARDFIKYGVWLAEPRQPEFFEGERVYSRKILGNRIVVTVEDGNSIADQQVYITKPSKDGISSRFLAGIIGSKFTAFLVKNYFNEMEDEFPQIKISQLKSLPIPDFEKSHHDMITQLVNRLLDLHKQSPRTPQENDLVKREILITEDAIDKVVYELYGLTNEEIKIIEEEVNN